MDENKPRGVPLSPKSMVDSVADWPLHHVIEHLRKKEKEEKYATGYIHCRSSIKSLLSVMDELALRYGTSRNRMSRWLAYQGLFFARDDATVARLVAVQGKIRQAALLIDDTDALDLMGGLLPYSPRVQEETDVHLPVYDWVSSEFDDLARACGVYKYHMVQVYQAKSVLMDDVESFAGTASRLVAEIARWDLWMGFRLGALSALAKE